MIVKNEAHVITNTLKHLLDFVPFDYWCISDTGSTDSTKGDITAFFKEKGIPGEIYDTEWRDFGYNRTVAFQKAFGKSDYVFVWDADDEIRGNFIFPKNLVADQYKFIFGNEVGLRYERVQLFNNKKQWEYVGVLHEYPRCKEPCESPAEVLGDYYFLSGRSGARNKNPNKYQDDARILDKAFKEALAANDQIHKRYAFYCAQSYCSARMDEKAIEYYKIVLTLDTWLQEKYMSCLSLYESYEKLGREKEGLVYLVESYKYDPNRVECYYRLIKYYCIHGPLEVAYAYYKVIEPYYENKFATDTFMDKLFVNKEDYEFYLPYYMTIVAGRIGKHELSAKMFGIIFKRKYLGASAWWIHNLFTNIQFCINSLPNTLEFLKDMFDYVDALRDRGILLNDTHNVILERLIQHYAPLITARPTSMPIITGSGSPPRVMLTMTTCKRYELFEKTVHSLINMWTDLSAVDSFFIVDDNSSEDDRTKMRERFPFFDYYMKNPSEKGHRESMNIIWNHLNTVKPTYWIHLEDDWMYFHQGSYVERGIQFLEKYKSQNIHQLVFNRNYGVVYKDLERTGGIVLEPGYILHEKRDDLPGHHCGYWPHYSLQPSISRVSTILEVGPYDSNHRFFERGQADKYFAKGFLTGFFNSIYSVHIGKQHWEKEGMNAYALNEVGQFAPVKPATPEPVTERITEIVKTEPVKPEPLQGTMREHLDAILKKIEAGTPFGLIRPSDGEYAILLNQTLTNCDNWTFQSGGILQKQLAESIRTVNPNLYIGIPCNTGTLPWNCTKEIYRNYLYRFKVPLAQRTYANIFMDSNWKHLIEFLKKYQRGFYSVTSGTSNTDLPIKDRFLIDRYLVNHWDTKHFQETARLMEFIREKRGELICFSAGPISKVWIPLCMKENPENMYMDVGSALDAFTRGVPSRPYMNPDHPFSKTFCQFDDSLHPKKNLLYMCVFFKQGYVELLKILLTSLKMFSNTDAFDILIFTSPEFEKEIQNFAGSIAITITCKTFEFKTVLEACCARLSIFDYNMIDSYEKVLYIDTDIVVQGDLSQLFEKSLEDKIYALSEWTISADSHGGSLFDFAKFNHNTPGFNSGILLFQTSPLMRSKFADISAHVLAAFKSGGRMPECHDQPFFNYHFIKDGLHETQLLEPYAVIYDRGSVLPEPKPTKICLCHFTWPLGNSENKGTRMKDYLLYISKHYRMMFGAEEFSADSPLLGRRYSWEKGYIQFGKGGVLHTGWSTGSYSFINQRTLYASWQTHKHILHFNSTFTNYVGIKMNEFGFCFGSLHTESLHTYQDASITLEETNTLVPFTGERNLVYACVFFKKSYIDLLKILLSSYKFFNESDTTDFLVLTSKDFEAEILAFAKSIDLPIRCKLFNITGLHEAATARVKIFSYENIGQYKKVLYLDTDVVVQGNLQTLFDLPIEDRIYALKEGIIEHEIHGGWFFDFTKIDKSKPAFNTGILLFPVSKAIQTKFLTICAHIERTKGHRGQMPECLDQGFLNYHFIKDGLYDISLLQDRALIYCVDPPPPPSAPTSVLLSHFVWPIGDGENKKKRMDAHLSHILKKYNSVYPTVGILDPSPILHKRYNWGLGYIQFSSGGILHTIWATGSYIMLDSRTVYVRWKEFEHVLRMNSTYDKYFVVRIGDVIVSSGSLETDNCMFKESARLQPAASTDFVNLPEKYLVYATVFYNRKYLDLLKILLVSYKMFSDSYDFLIMISPDFEAELLAYAKTIGVSIHCKVIDFSKREDAFCARLHIFQYEKIGLYKKVLYVDTDIVIQGNLKKIFDLCREDRLYALSENMIDKESHGGWFFDFMTISKNTAGINSGILLFNTSNKMREKFHGILQHIDQIKLSQGRIPKCFDQPFLNYHFIKDSLHETTALKDFAKLYYLTAPPPPSMPTDMILCHFAEPLGDPVNKRKRMEKHFSHLLQHYSQIYPTTTLLDVVYILGKRYTWSGGYIEFHTNGTLKTAWSPGKYTILDKNCILVSWMNYSHIIQMNDTFTEYISVRLGDCIISSGQLL